MKHLLLATPLLLLPADAGLELAPEANLALTKTFTGTVQLEGGDLEVVMDGQPVPAEFLPDLEVTSTDRTEVVFTDRYVRTADGRVLELVRTFDELSEEHTGTQTMSGQGMDDEAETSTEADSELEGESVRFTWDADDEAYGVDFERGEDGGDDHLLEGLVASADLTAFLSEDEVGQGDRWTVPAEAFAELFQPSGDVAMEFSGDEADTYNSDDVEFEFDGELDVKYASSHARGGQELAVLSIEGEVELSIEVPTTLDAIPVVDGTAMQTLVHKMTLEGELVWNLSAGHAVSIELGGPVEAEMHLVKDADNPGPTFESTVRLLGECNFAAAFEAAD